MLLKVQKIKLSADIKAVDKKVDDVSTAHKATGIDVIILSKRIADVEKLKTTYLNAIRTNENNLLLAKFKSKQYNLLIHGVEENATWENATIATNKAKIFLKYVLEIVEDIVIQDCHRLNVRKPLTDGKVRPIIFKIQTMTIKKTLF